MLRDKGKVPMRKVRTERPLDMAAPRPSVTSAASGETAAWLGLTSKRKVRKKEARMKTALSAANSL